MKAGHRLTSVWTVHSNEWVMVCRNMLTPIHQRMYGYEDCRVICGLQSALTARQPQLTLCAAWRVCAAVCSGVGAAGGWLGGSAVGLSAARVRTAL